MDENHQFRAFCAILLAICYLVTLAVIAACLGHAVESVGAGGAVLGLIGLAKFPSSKSVTIDNKPSDPVPTTEAE